nr:endo-1,3;1,4-beta-D-glucanase-like [Quercus suber]
MAIAASGFYAVVPNFLHGEPLVLNDPNRPLQVWLKDHGMVYKGTEEAKPVIEALKSKGFSTVGAAGFCWGAKVVVELGKTDEHIQAVVILHPSFVTPDDIKGMKVPIAILFSEFGDYSKPKLFKQLDDVLASKSDEVDGYVKIFPKVEHGWTVRYNVEDAAAVKSAEEAHQDMLEWFAKYVK